VKKPSTSGDCTESDDRICHLSSLDCIWAIRELSALFSLVISFNLTCFYAVIAQLLVFLRTKAGTLVTGTVGAVILLPRSFSVYCPFTEKISWSVAVYTLCLGVDRTCQCHQLLALLGQWSILTLFSLQMTRQLRRPVSLLLSRACRASIFAKSWGVNSPYSLPTPLSAFSPVLEGAQLWDISLPKQLVCFVCQR